MDKIQEFQQKINALIQKQDFSKSPAELYEPICYVMSQEGKRLRPLLTLLACDLFDGDIQKALYPAMAIEVFHNFTLVHDDIMDNAPLRRGKETVYKKWNSNIAILAGDTMFAMAYQYAVKTDPELIPDILGVFSQAAIEVCEGQQLDMNFENLELVTIDDYLNMIRLKTAVLLGASLKIGAITAMADAQSIKDIYDFGIHLGIAFQLKDDLLDVYGNEQKFGKMSGGDIAANKKTYLYLKALELADIQQREELSLLYKTQPENPEEKIVRVKEIFNSLQIENYVSNVMEEFYEKSLGFLDEVKADLDKKGALRSFAAQLYHRIH
jgi:geranylgeranyl diphosphate synthase, type II